MRGKIGVKGGRYGLRERKTEKERERESKKEHRSLLRTGWTFKCISSHTSACNRKILIVNICMKKSHNFNYSILSSREHKHLSSVEVMQTP